MKLIDSLRSEIESTRENQSHLNVSIAKIIGFIKRIELHAEGGEEETDADNQTTSRQKSSDMSVSVKSDD